MKDVQTPELGPIDITRACPPCVALVGIDPDTREVAGTAALWGDEDGRLESLRITVEDAVGNRAIVDLPTQGTLPGKRCTAAMEACPNRDQDDVETCGAGLVRVLRKHPPAL